MGKTCLYAVVALFGHPGAAEAYKSLDGQSPSLRPPGGASRIGSVLGWGLVGKRLCTKSSHCLLSHKSLPLQIHLVIP